MIEKLIAKKDELNNEINKKNKEYEKTFRKLDKIRKHTELKMLEGKYKAYVEIIRMMEENNDK